MFRKISFSISLPLVFLLFSSFYSFSENVLVDSLEGINFYERYNPQTGGDSIRVDEVGTPAEKWVIDYYDNGSVLHRGYYEDGKLKIYKNYYPNGIEERRFKGISMVKSLLETFFSNGTVRAKLVYLMENIVQSEYHSRKNGSIEFSEKYSDHGQLLYRFSYTDDGLPETSFEVISKKQQSYLYKEYHDNGTLKEKGKMIFSDNVFDYQRNGSWYIYNKNGVLQKEQEYANGSFISERDVSANEVSSATAANETGKSRSKKNRGRSKKFLI